MEPVTRRQRPPAVHSPTYQATWAGAWIEQLAEEGITIGYLDGTFRPQNNFTRAEMAVFLVNAFELTAPQYSPRLVNFGAKRASAEIAIGAFGAPGTIRTQVPNLRYARSVGCTRVFQRALVDGRSWRS